jgi:hypothetical protein
MTLGVSSQVIRLNLAWRICLDSDLPRQVVVAVDEDVARQQVARVREGART